MDTERRKWVDRMVQSHDLSALIFWRPDELVMMLGYMPLWGLSFLVYTADHDPVLFVPELEPEDLLPRNITVKKFPWGNKSCSDPWEILYKEMGRVLQQKHLLNKPVSFIKSIGGTAPCRMSAEQPLLPADIPDRLSEVSGAGFKDTATDLLLLYQHKTKTDIEGLKLAHKVTEVAVNVFYLEAKAGITEARLAALIDCSVQEMAGQKNISFAKAWPMVQSGENTGYGGKFNRTTGKTISENELVMLEMSVCVNGYWADVTRMAKTGKIDNSHVKILETVAKAQEIALAMLKPGVEMGRVDAAARNYIEEAGFGPYFNHALGHQVGFRYHDPGPGLSPGCTNFLEEGMVLTVEPGIYGVELGGGVRIEDNILITANGYELLSDYS